MREETVQQATLRRARDLAGGVSLLAHKVGVSANDLDAMMHGLKRTPSWVLLRVADFINDMELQGLSRAPGSAGEPAGEDKPEQE